MLSKWVTDTITSTTIITIITLQYQLVTQLTSQNVSLMLKVLMLHIRRNMVLKIQREITLYLILESIMISYQLKQILIILRRSLEQPSSWLCNKITLQFQHAILQTSLNVLPMQRVLMSLTKRSMDLVNPRETILYLTLESIMILSQLKVILDKLEETSVFLNLNQYLLATVAIIQIA